MPSKKNNHYVPQSYLRNFSAGSERQIGLYNLKRKLLIERASIRDQCARDYFYSKNPTFEDMFAAMEGVQHSVFRNITHSEELPDPHTPDHVSIISSIMLQAGRTAAIESEMNSMTDSFAKTLFRRHLLEIGEIEMAENLDKFQITQDNIILKTVRTHLIMAPLLFDMDVFLLINQTKEDFITSDHPIVLSNGFIRGKPGAVKLGFASRGLMIIFPISPRHILLLSDPEVYKVHATGRKCYVMQTHDAANLNVLQATNAEANIYFSDKHRIPTTLATIQDHSLPMQRSVFSETQITEPDGREQVLLHYRRQAPPAPNLPFVTIRLRARQGKFRFGNERIRDQEALLEVRAKLDKIDRRDAELRKHTHSPKGEA